MAVTQQLTYDAYVKLEVLTGKLVFVQCHIYESFWKSIQLIC